MKIGRLRSGLRKVWGAVAAILSDTDTYVFGGIALVAAGLAMWSVSIALVVTGVLVLGVGVWLSAPPGAAHAPEGGE